MPSPTSQIVPDCAACGHRWNTHDEIAARFCAATVVGKFSRGCVCVPATPEDSA
jgi:hypothetical protein